MKHLMTILATILAITLFASCEPQTKTTMMKMVEDNYNPPYGFAGFEEYKTICLCDEVSDQIKTFKYKKNWDESFYDTFRENVEDGVECNLPEDYILHKYSFYKNEIKKDERMLAHLKSIEKNYPDDFYNVSFTIYKMSYLAMDKDGNKIHNNCYGRFNKDGKLVAFKLTDESKWTVLGNCLSIPQYYDIINN